MPERASQNPHCLKEHPSPKSHPDPARSRRARKSNRTCGKVLACIGRINRPEPRFIVVSNYPKIINDLDNPCNDSSASWVTLILLLSPKMWRQEEKEAADD